jgi:predicted N-acetyltransferase YhbS
METQYSTAELKDREELMDFGNYVFSHAHASTDFPSLLPKLYKQEYFMEGIHYIAREDGRIRAAVGAYPLKLNILGEILPGRGIGMVSVHPYTRSRGYMRTLMEMARIDMRRDGIVFSCLGGQRQRYEYFGFTPAGIQVVFECRRANIRHFLGRDPSPDLSLRQLKEGDGELEDIYRFHQTKAARFERDRGKFFDILSSWKNRVFVLMDKNRFAGYMIYNDAENTLAEINLADPGRAAEALACFLNSSGEKNGVSVNVQPWETDKLEAFAAFAEDYRLSTAYSFAVLDWQPFFSALLKLRFAEDRPAIKGKQSAFDGQSASDQIFPEGEAVFRIGQGNTPEGRETSFRVTVRDGKVQVTPDSGAGAIVLDSLQAIRLFFSPLSLWASPILRRNPFLRSILPLPLFFETPDGV